MSTFKSSSSDIIQAGFIPLIDCAPLVIAKEKGFAKQEGINLKLNREVSWANIRDRLNVGQFDVAHMLAGMPIAANLGIGQIKTHQIAPIALGRGGNAVTVSKPLYSALNETGRNIQDALAAGQALRKILEDRRDKGQDPLTFAMVFPFSNHNYQLCHWLEASGIDPANDLRLIVIPPPFMVQSLEAGQIDGFCVGEPWNSLAAKQKVGEVLFPTAKVWPRGPEKVLGMQRDWAETNSAPLSALLRALDLAATWSDDGKNRLELSRILARKDYLGVDSNQILAALQTGMKFSRGNGVEARQEDALWLYAQMVRWGQISPSTEAWSITCETYRPDLLSTALGEHPKNTGGINRNLITPPLSDIPFDPQDVEGYVLACQR